ncbi:lipocalin-like domain-containing protein [Streptomyces sp. NPDC006678]|uniref:lipocalin-like domain-containing protein n=1 Tax=Streptomyces sp. NPDC006678 TaxID=3157185 RepID=UPI0033E961FF
MNSLVGAWVLEDCSLTREGAVVRPLGEHPSGVLLYTADGWMSALLTAPPDDAPAASAFEETASGTVAYAGRWEREADGPVMHRVQASHYTPWAGTALVRDGCLANRHDGRSLKAVPCRGPSGGCPISRARRSPGMRWLP